MVKVAHLVLYLLAGVVVVWVLGMLGAGDLTGWEAYPVALVVALVLGIAVERRRRAVK